MTTPIDPSVALLVQSEREKPDTRTYMYTASKQKTQKRTSKDREAVAARALALVRELAQRVEVIESGLAAVRVDVARLAAGGEEGADG